MPHTGTASASYSSTVPRHVIHQHRVPCEAVQVGNEEGHSTEGHMKAHLTPKPSLARPGQTRKRDAFL